MELQILAISQIVHIIRYIRGTTFVTVWFTIQNILLDIGRIKELNMLLDILLSGQIGTASSKSTAIT